MHQLFDAVNVISVQGYDNERRVIYWNEGSVRLYGYTKEEDIGQKIEDLIIPESMCEFVIDAHSDWVEKDIEIPASEITLKVKMAKVYLFFLAMICLQINIIQNKCIALILTYLRLKRHKQMHHLMRIC
ncbi:PAS domain-containing protein [Pseudoalteromonas sp. B193]